MANAMKDQAAISSDWVQEMMDQNAAASPEVQRLRDSAENMGLAKVALNRKVIAHHNTRYTNTIPNGPITNQAQSGRCWIFAGLNMIRSALLSEKRLPEDFEFSENYIYFFSMLEQSNQYIKNTMGTVLAQMAGSGIHEKKFRAAVTPVNKLGDGGYFNWFQFLVSKYGLVPKQAMAEAASSQSSRLLNSDLTSALAVYAEELMNLMNQKLSPATVQKAFEAKGRAMSRVWKILSTHLGTPPAYFDYRLDANVAAPKMPDSKGTKIVPAKISRYTPKKFALDFIGFNPDDYVTLANYPHKENGNVYEIRNSAIGVSKPGDPPFNHRFLQTNARRMAEMVAAAIDDGRPVWFASEMGRDVDNDTGIMHPKIYDRQPIYGFSKSEQNEKLSKDKAAYFWVRVLNHAMVFTGYDRPNPETPIVKLRVENSWGTNFGSKGIYHMYLDWFNENVYQVIIHKKFLNNTEKKAWAGKATQLNDWSDAL